MAYEKTAAPIIGNCVMLPDWELQPHVVAEIGLYQNYIYLGALDAPWIMVSGSCKRRDYKSFALSGQHLHTRGVLDAYDYTDRTARATDCASEGM